MNAQKFILSFSHKILDICGLPRKNIFFSEKAALLRQSGKFLRTGSGGSAGGLPRVCGGVAPGGAEVDRSRVI